MSNNNKTKNNYMNNFYSSQIDKRSSYISRSTNKKISSDKYSKNLVKNNSKENFKITATLMEINRFQNKNIKYKKPELSQNNSLYNLMAKNQNENKNLNAVSIPKTKLIFQEKNSHNSSLVFNIYEDMKIKNNNSVISINKQNTKNNISNIVKKNKNKNSNINNKMTDKNNINLNIQKYSIKSNYEYNPKNYGKFIYSNNNSKEEKFGNNKNIYNNNNELILYSNNNNNINYISNHKNKYNNNTNKDILQKYFINLFSSNKKKNSVKKNNNNNRENKFINDSFNNNKKSNLKISNNFNKEENNLDKRKVTPKLNSNNINNKKVSGLFSANHKEKVSNIITEICNSKSKKMSENITKRNLSINIHSCNINENKFKTSVNLEIFNVNNNKNLENNIPKLNLNQVFNLKLFDKNKMGKNYSNFYCSNISVKSDKNIKEHHRENAQNAVNLKNKKLQFINNNNNDNNINNNNMKKRTNNFNSNANFNANGIQNNKKEEKKARTNYKYSSNKNNYKFSPKNIYTKDIKKSHLQRFFSYSKEKVDPKDTKVNFMNNIKKINFNENTKSSSKNSARNLVKSTDNKSQININEIKNIDNLNNSNTKKKNSSEKFKKKKEIINDTYINLRKRRARYSDINKIIETNNLKCMKNINNSEINNIKNNNNNNKNIYKNHNSKIKNKNMQNNNLKRSSHSASHNNLNNNKAKYDISKIGNLFKPQMENKIRGSYKEANRKKEKNFDLLSSLGKKPNMRNSYAYSYKKNHRNSEYYKSIKIKNIYRGIYDSNIKENNVNIKINAKNHLPKEDMNHLETDENKTNENVIQNSLTLYSIYILSKYYKTCDKIGISKIALYDINKNPIPIEHSSTSDGININYVFDLNPQFSYLADFNNDINNIPLIANFTENFYINFSIKNVYNSSFKYIFINNYSDVNNGISPVNEIKIFKSNIFLYKGLLNINDPNVIQISNLNSEQDKGKLSINDLITNEKSNENKNKGKSLTFTIFKSLIKDNLDNNNNDNDKDINFKMNKFNSARNTFHKNYNKNSEESNNNQIRDSNIYFNKSNNKSNSFANNNEFNNIENENEKSNNLLFFETNNENTKNNFYDNMSSLSKTSSYNLNYYGSDFNLNFPISENQFSKTLKFPNYTNKLFLNSYNSAFDDCDNLFKTSLGYINKPNDSEIFNNNNNLYNNEYNILYGNINVEKNYVEFNKIRIYLKSNYGHKRYIGLTGIIFIDENQQEIDIEKASAIGALPKDLRTIYKDDSDNRIFENVFNGINNTNDIDNMWVTKVYKNKSPPYLELYFEEKIKLSKIIIYNYNEKNKLEICTKTIEIYLDDYYYKTINLIQGIGEIANVDKESNLNDFGQEICINNDYDISDFNKLSTGLTIYDANDYKDIKYASNIFEQSYETPYLPSGNIIKFQFLSYYYNSKENHNNNNYSEEEEYLGLDNIEIFNEEGINILNFDNNKNNNYKVISNRKINNINKNNCNKNILIQCINDKDEYNNIVFNNENYLFYIYDKSIQISYIKFTPFRSNKNVCNNKVYKIKEIKLFCDDKIIFEGILYDNKPTIILFTSEYKIINGINRNYLTKYTAKRKIEEHESDNYYSLILS